MILTYGFLDVSGSGFGSTLLRKVKIHYPIGTWSSSEDSNTSNWREFENLLCDIEEAGNKCCLTGSTIVLATDNLVVEAAMYKCNSSSGNLFDLVVHFRQEKLQFSTKTSGHSRSKHNNDSSGY